MSLFYIKDEFKTEVTVIVILVVFADSNASDQPLLVSIMRRLRRRSQSTSGREKDRVSISLLCLPRPLLRRGAPPSLPSAVEVSPVSIASSRPRRSTEIDEINHVEDVEQPGKNGVSSGAGLLGGNGLQNYDRFIATLLRERSAVKDGGVAPTTADQPRQQTNRPRTLKTRLRKRRPLTDNVEHQPNINGFDDSRCSVGATGMIGKPAYDRSLWLKSEPEQFLPAASNGVGISTYAGSVPGRRSGTELDPYRSTMEMSESDDTCGTSTKLDTIEGSPRRRQRQRQRQRSRRKNDRRRGSAAVSEECDTAVSQARVHADDLTKKSKVMISSDSETELATHFDEAMLDQRQPGRADLPENCAYRERFDRGDTAVLHSPNRAVYKLSGIITTNVFNDSEDELSTDFKKAKEDRRYKDEVFGLSVDTSTIQFIDCDSQKLELFDMETTPSIPLSHEDRAVSTGTSLVADEWRNAGGGKLMAFSTPSLRASSRQVGQHLTRSYVDGILRSCCCTVCRRSSAQYGVSECSAPVRQRRQHRSHPLLYHSRADQTTSPFDKSPRRLTRDAAHRSQLLDSCRCSITWSSSVEEPEDTDYDSTQSPQSTDGPIQSSVTETISTAAKLSLPLSNDVQHSLADSRQYSAVPCVSSPSNKVVQLVPSRSRGDHRHRSMDEASVGRRTVQVFCVFGRRRRNGCCGGKAARCFLKIRFTLTRSQTEDLKTTLIFAQTKTEEHEQFVNDALNLPVCRCSTCSTSDVMLTVISDDSRDAVDDNKQTIELAPRCAAVESLTESLPSSEDRTFNISPDLAGLHPVVDTVDLAAYVGTVGDVTTCEITSGNVIDVSQSLMMYEFAEVTSIFRNFAADLLHPKDRELSLVPYAARRWEDRSTTTALVLRAAPGVTYNGAVVPYSTHLPVFFPLPLMTWSWNQDDFTESHQRQATNDYVTHIPYISACKTVNVDLSIDHFTLITFSSNSVRSLSLVDRTQETQTHEASSSR